MMAQYNLLVALCLACAVASSSLDGTSTVRSSTGATTPTEETTVNDDIDLRELNGGVLLHFDDVMSTERDRKIERDNAESLVERGNDKSLSPLRDIHRNGRNDKSDQEVVKEGGIALGVYDALLQEEINQIGNGATTSASEEQVSGKEGGNKTEQT